MKLITICLLIMSYSLTAQSTILSRLQLELFILIEEIGSINDYGIFFELKSQQPFVYENDKNRYVFNKVTDEELLEGTYPYDAPGPYYHDIIKENSTYPNNMTWKGFDFISGSEEDEGEHSDFAYGLYKLTPYEVDEVLGTTTELGGAFYLDMRDSHYPRINGYPADFFFLYNCDDQEFKTSGF